MKNLINQIQTKANLSHLNDKEFAKVLGIPQSNLPALKKSKFMHTDKLIQFMKLLNVDCIEDDTENYKLTIKLK